MNESAARMMIVGIQGEVGSACDAASVKLLEGFPRRCDFRYHTNAANVIGALRRGDIDGAVIVLESPVGVPVPETAEVLCRTDGIEILTEISCEVRHCLMALPGVPRERICKVASHAIPLSKHRERLIELLPGYSPLEVADTGLAARLLATGILDAETAVIALPRAAELFGLTVFETELPANDDYLTRFAFVRRRM